MEGKRLVGTGAASRLFGVSPSLVRKWEERGLIPVADRIEGSGRRVWTVGDLDAARERVAAARVRPDQSGVAREADAMTAA